MSGRPIKRGQQTRGYGAGGGEPTAGGVARLERGLREPTRPLERAATSPHLALPRNLGSIVPLIRDVDHPRHHTRRRRRHWSVISGNDRHRR